MTATQPIATQHPHSPHVTWYTMTDNNTGKQAHIFLTERTKPLGATVEAWFGHLTRADAERYGVLASATLTMQEGDSINTYTQRIYEQAAILGMDTLRELAKPLLRDVPTSGEA